MKRKKLEGHAPTRLIQLMQKHGYNEGVQISLGTITAPLPNVKLRIDGVGITFDQDDVVITDTANTASLAEGDRVLVLWNSESQFYAVIDKVV